MPNAGSIKAGSARLEPTADDAKLVQAMGKLEVRAKAHGQTIGSQLVSGISERVAGLVSVTKPAFEDTKSAVEGAAEREKAEYRVAAALKMIGEYTDANYVRAVAFAGQLAKETSLTRDQAMAVETLGIQLGKLSGAPLEIMTKAAIGWAAWTHMGAEEAMQKMIIAERPDGQQERRMFEPYMPEGNSLERMNSEQRQAALMGTGMEGYDAARSEMLGMAGDIERGSHAWQDFKDELAAAAYESGNLSAVPSSLTEEEEGSTTQVEELGEALGALIDSVIIPVTGAALLLREALNGLWAVCGMVTGGLEEVVAGLGRLIKHIPGLGSVGKSLAKWGEAGLDEQSKDFDATWGDMKASAARWWKMTRPMLMSEQAKSAESEATETALREEVKSELTAHNPGHTPTDIDIEVRLAQKMRERGMRYRPPGRKTFLAGTEKHQRGEAEESVGSGMNEIFSAAGLSGAIPGGISYPGAASMPGQPVAPTASSFSVNGSADERAAAALETYLPIIAENTRKDPRAPYQVNQ